MKKLLILLLVFGMASASQAAVVGFSIGGAKEYTASPGETVSIDLVADTAYNGSEMMAVEGDDWVAANVLNKGGTSALPIGTTGVTITGGYLDNYNGVLFDYASAYASPAKAAGLVIMSFEYTLSTGWDGSAYWVSPLVEGTSYEYASGAVDNAALSYARLGELGDIGITGVKLVPEPMTIVLLGLGGLFLRRRK